jgi:hypothetical protein
VVHSMDATCVESMQTASLCVCFKYRMPIPKTLGQGEDANYTMSAFSGDLCGED